MYTQEEIREFITIKKAELKANRVHYIGFSMGSMEFSHFQSAYNDFHGCLLIDGKPDESALKTCKYSICVVGIASKFYQVQDMCTEFYEVADAQRAKTEPKTHQGAAAWAVSNFDSLPYLVRGESQGYKGQYSTPFLDGVNKLINCP